MTEEERDQNDILDSLRFQIEWYDYVLNNRLCDDANKVLVYEGKRQALQSDVDRIVTAKYSPLTPGDDGI